MVVHPPSWAGSGCARALSGVACWLCLGFVAAGCQTLPPSAALEEPSEAQQLSEQAQEALRQGNPEQAIELCQKSLQADPDLARNHLSLAAAYLEQGDEERACPHLAGYLAAHPDHLVVRGQYAELLLRLRRLPEARTEFERCLPDAQALGDTAIRQLVHCHSRLMEIAEAEEQEYDAHLHRGIGLYLLTCAHTAEGDGPEGQAPESLLCKAAAELSLAHLERPDQAQPCWYLYQVWTRLAQRAPALRSLRQAEEAAPFSYLTPQEQDRLHLACCRHEPTALPK